jgi:hypothetical protein
MLTLSVKTVMIAVFVLICILMILFFGLILHKSLNNRKASKIDLLKHKIQPLVFKNLFKSENKQLEPYKNNKLFHQAVLELMNEINSQLDMGMLDELKTKFYEKYLVPAIRSKLKSHRWSIRMNMLYLMESLGDTAMYIDLWKIYHMRHTTDQEKYIILRIAAQSNDVHVLTYLVEDPPYQTVYFYKQVISKMSDELFSRFIASFDKYPQKIKISVLSVIGEKRKLTYLPQVEKHLEDPTLDIRIHSLKTIRDFAYISDLKKLLPFAAADTWVEQMIFCQIARELKNPGYLPSLGNLLTSPNWWVRYYSGEAMARTPGGFRALTKIEHNSSDMFAQDMAGQWLQRMEMDI